MRTYIVYFVQRKEESIARVTIANLLLQHFALIPYYVWKIPIISCIYTICSQVKGKVAYVAHLLLFMDAPCQC